MMNEKTERRAIAFIRTIANRCGRCLHRTPENCHGCVSQWANEIMADRENGMSFGKPIDYSIATRKTRILDILRQAGRPLLASEIDIADICSKGLKQWTLRRMVKAGLIRRIPNDDPGDCRNIYLYSIVTKKNNRKEQSDETDHQDNSGSRSARH